MQENAIRNKRWLAEKSNSPVLTTEFELKNINMRLFYVLREISVLHELSGIISKVYLYTGIWDHVKKTDHAAQIIQTRTYIL